MAAWGPMQKSGKVDERLPCARPDCKNAVPPKKAAAYGHDGESAIGAGADPVAADAVRFPMI